MSELLREVEVDGRIVDVRIEHGRVTAIAERLARRRGEPLADGGGGALLPGLHDHHIHLLATAALARSVRVGPPAAHDHQAFADALRQAAETLPPDAWIRAVGYHERVAGALDRWALDALIPDRPVRVQHRSGAMWVLNSAGVRLAHLDDAGKVPGLERRTDGTATGRLYGLDDWLRDRVPSEPPDLAALGERLLSYGVTGVTDATPTEDAAEFELLAAATTRGDLPQHVVVTGSPFAGDTTAPSLPRGPAKLVVADHDLPPLGTLVEAMRAARRRGRAVAVHCVTRVALILTLTAFEEVGVVPGDRIEHGAVFPLVVAATLAHRQI